MITLIFQNISLFKNVERKKKRSKRFSGGIVVLYKSKFKNGVHELKTFTSSENRIWFKLNKQFFGFQKDLYVCACYVPPVGSPYYDDDITALENEISRIPNPANILIIGDFNARIGNKPDFIENENLCNSLQTILPDNYCEDNSRLRNTRDNVFNTQGQALIDLCLASQLRVLNGRYIGDFFGNFTCHKSYGSSVVDYALADTDLLNYINFFKVDYPTYLSDHSQISVHIDCQMNYSVSNTCNTQNFKSLSTSYKWESVSKSKLLTAISDEAVINNIVSYESTNFGHSDYEINKASNQLTHILENITKMSCKMFICKKKRKPKKVWLDNEVRDMKKTVAELGKQMGSQPFNLQLRHNFFLFSKKLKKLVKRKKYLFKKNIFDKLIEWKETDPKQYWHLLNILKLNEQKNFDLSSYINTENIREHFQSQGKPEYYNTEFSRQIDDNIEKLREGLKENEYTDRPFTVQEIKKCVNKLRIGKSAGPDCIPNEIIKFSSVVTCKSITKLFNLILDSGKYPDNWRKSYTVLIFKSGDFTNLNNYRGISLQNCIAKLFSAVMNCRVLEYYENLFANQQFGFRTNHRTTDSIFILKSLISKYVNKNKDKIYACFVDLRRAFDSLWHNGLRYKLIKDGLGRKLLNVISDMYSSCESAVKFDHKISNFFELERGVKQGDSLSPTLFNCFINDMHQIFDQTCQPLVLQNSEISSLSFADDLVIFSKTHTGLQNCLLKLEKYCYDWQLTVNVKKTKVLTFQNRYSPTHALFYNNCALDETKEYNFLGNVIDYRGSFKRTVQELTKKGLKAVFALKSRFSNFQSIPVNLSLKLFDTLVRPILLYNSEIWFMENYINILKSSKRAEQHGSICDILSLEDKFSFEIVHNRYCKSVLGLKKTACNIAAKLELGRFPLASFIKTQAMLYFCRLNSTGINPLLYEALQLNKTLDSQGIYTWYSFACNIFKEANLDISDFDDFDKSFRNIKFSLKKKFKRVNFENYTSRFFDKLSSLTDSSKLLLYSKLKTEFKIEDYLLATSSFETRQLLTKFRVSDHPLAIETGRYKNIPRENRLCTICNKIDDESHFFIECVQNKTLRDHLFSKISNTFLTFTRDQPFNQLQTILNPNLELLPAIRDFIKQSLELRK